MKRLDEKLARIRAGRHTKRDFIIADAKDGDMGPAMTGVGPHRDARGRLTGRLRTRPEFLDSVRAIVHQDVVDIMLLSASNVETLAIDEGMFKDSAVTPAVRANDTTDIWVGRGCSYSKEPSRAFRSCSLPQVMYGTREPRPELPVVGSDLGLYSITFTNNLDADYKALEAFTQFRADAAACNFKYFLEVFNPNVECGLDAEAMPKFVNDCIVRCLAGVQKADRPQFLKIAYNGPAALEELAAYDPTIVVGILGGGAGTTLDTFRLLQDAQKYGAHVALFGRKINLAESPLDIVRYMRAVADGDVAPEEAVKSYHADLARADIPAMRSLADDLVVTEAAIR